MPDPCGSVGRRESTLKGLVTCCFLLPDLEGSWGTKTALCGPPAPAAHTPLSWPSALHLGSWVRLCSSVSLRTLNIPWKALCSTHLHSGNWYLNALHLGNMVSLISAGDRCYPLPPPGKPENHRRWEEAENWRKPSRSEAPTHDFGSRTAIPHGPGFECSGLRSTVCTSVLWSQQFHVGLVSSALVSEAWSAHWCCGPSQAEGGSPASLAPAWCF